MSAGRVSMATTLKVATTSLKSAMANVEANLKRALEAMAQAAGFGAENFSQAVRES